jgi:hypothetical protein
LATQVGPRLTHRSFGAAGQECLPHGVLHFRGHFGEAIAKIGRLGGHRAASRLENKGFLVFEGAMEGELFPFASIGLPFVSI